LPIDPETLKPERDKLKERLRELEADQRKLETELKNLRQQEIRTKREIEALTTLIELNEAKDGRAEDKPKGKKSEEASAG
jgi:predicted  nucleic acid-binding Zn-ribbon protein